MLKDPEYYSSMNTFVGVGGYPFMNRCGPLAHLRFCSDCGMRPLPGPFRYGPGAYFLDSTKNRKLVRCKLCGEDAVPPPKPRHSLNPLENKRCGKPGVCAACHGVDDGHKLCRVEGPRGPSLMDLSTKLHLAIVANLSIHGRGRLRKVSRYFRATIPPPTHVDLLTAEKQDWFEWHGLLACGGCIRLREEVHFGFAPQMKHGYRGTKGKREFDPKMAGGGAFAHVRFCNECGVRPLPGNFRYMLGEHWSDEQKKRPAERCGRCWLKMGTAIDFVRCRKCPADDNVQEAPHCIHVGLCTVHYAEEKEVRRPKQEEEKQSWLLDTHQIQVTKRDHLTTLDLNVLAVVVSHLGSDDQMMLRGVCTFFNELVPRFIHEDLLEVELEEWAISDSLPACGGCVRLRHQSRFGYRVVYGDDWEFGGWIVPYAGGENAKKRYCNDCGIRDLPGEYRYAEGAHWLYDEEGNPGAEFVRCKESCCGNIAKPPEGIYCGIGKGCYNYRVCPNKTPYPNSVLDPAFPKRIWKMKQYFGRPLITSLPAELILSIAENLRLDELILLRGVSRFFHNTIPPPTHQQLLLAETEGWAITSRDYSHLLACGGCLRLRKEHRFGRRFFNQYTSRNENVIPGFEACGARAAERFCNDCGLRKLPGDFRWWLGAHFEPEDGPETLVRCKKCGVDRRPPLRNEEYSGYIEAGLCEPCYIDKHGRTRVKKNKWKLSKIENLSMEVIHAIIRHLDFPDRMTLRLVSHNLKYDIPRPTHHQLFLAEQEDWAVAKDVLACGGCVRLRHESKFNSRMISEDIASEEHNLYAGMHRGGTKGHKRFCHDCGVRALPGKYRYQLGHHWYDKDKNQEVVRCKMCELDKEPPEGVEKGLCRDCWDGTSEDGFGDTYGLQTSEVYR